MIPLRRLVNLRRPAAATRSNLRSAVTLALLVTAALAQPAIPSVAAGGGRSLVLRTDGTVWSFGRGDAGALGNGSTADSAYPVPVAGLTSVIAIATGTSHSLAVRADGTVWAFGSNAAGQLGTGGPASSVTTAVQVGGLSNVMAVAAGSQHSLALRADGTVYAWGGNAFGQVGNGTLSNVSTPTPIAAAAGAVAIGAGATHSLAVLSSGTVLAWGQNHMGQLGNGTLTASPVPVAASGLTGVVAVAGGFSFSLALRADGSVWAFGDNGSGQLGNGSVVSSTVPTPSLTPSGITAIAAGDFHGLVRRQDGTVWTLGEFPVDNANIIPPPTVPVQVPWLSGIVAIAADFYHALAVRNDGAVWAWGEPAFGALGDGSTGGTPLPAIVQRLPSTATGVAGGEAHGLALAGGTVWAFGSNTSGQLGFPLDPGSAPAPNPSLTSVVKVAAAGRHGLAVHANGSVSTWGANTFGQLGNGTVAPSPTPATLAALTGITGAAAGPSHSLVLRNDGTVFGFGRNDRGQLGTGSASASPLPTPTAALGIGPFASVAAGGSHSLALDAAGRVSSAGDSEYGQLGYGTTLGYSTVFGQIGNLASMTMVSLAAGAQHSLCARSDGVVYSWGRNQYGQLGNGTSLNVTTPIPIPGFTGAVVVAAGSRHSLILKNDGTVWACGENAAGQLGDGTYVNRLVPVPVVGLSGIVAIAAGSLHSYALGGDGTLWAWGANGSGQLGSGAAFRIPVRCRIHASLPSQPWIDLAKTGLGGATLAVSDLPPGASSGFTLISATPATPPGFGSLFGLSADEMTLLLILGSPVPAPGHPISWVANVPGVFPDLPLQIPAGTMSFFAGQTWDALALASTPSGFRSSNVVRVAW